MTPPDLTDLEQLVRLVGDDDDEISHAAEAAIDGMVGERVVDEPEFVPNRALTPDQVPVGTRDQHAVARLAYTYNAYSTFGHNGVVLRFGNAARGRFRRTGKVPETVTGTRTALFIEARRRVHQAVDITEAEWPYTDALLRSLRDALIRAARG
jgi:hypothetical protein